jgi:hypothetical protein
VKIKTHKTSQGYGLHVAWRFARRALGHVCNHDQFGRRRSFEATMIFQTSLKDSSKNAIRWKALRDITVQLVL